jgi:actin-related protein
LSNAFFLKILRFSYSSLHEISHLYMNPKNKELILCENELWPTILRDTLLELFFQQFHIKTVQFLPSCLVSLLSVGRLEGLVVETGYLGIQLHCIYDGRLLLSDYWPMGGSFLTEKFKKSLLQTGKKYDSQGNHVLPLDKQDLQDISLKEWENIKAQLLTFNKEKTETWIDIQIGKQTFCAPCSIGHSVAMSLFSFNEDGNTLFSCISQLIQKAPIDLRRMLIENMYITGGLVEIPGWKDSFLQHLDVTFQKTVNLKQLKVKLIDSCFSPFTTAWTGASLFCQLKGVSGFQIYKSES